MSTRGDEKSAGVTSGTPIKSSAEKSHSAPTIVGESMNIRKIANHSTNTAISTTEATERSTSGRAASSASSSAVAASSSVVSAFPLDATVKSWKEVWAELKKLGWTCKNGKGLMVDYFYIKPGRKLKGGVLGDDYFIGHEDVMQSLLSLSHRWGAAALRAAEASSETSFMLVVVVVVLAAAGGILVVVRVALAALAARVMVVVLLANGVPSVVRVSHSHNTRMGCRRIATTAPRALAGSSYDQMRRQLRMQHKEERGLQGCPLHHQVARSRNRSS